MSLSRLTVFGTAVLEIGGTFGFVKARENSLAGRGLNHIGGGGGVVSFIAGRLLMNAGADNEVGESLGAEQRAIRN